MSEPSIREATVQVQIRYGARIAELPDFVDMPPWPRNSDAAVAALRSFLSSVHRDIKPSNILVATQDGVAVPKVVIDFGIAKATQGRLIDDTVFTAFEQFLGTPPYRSPEQAQLGGLDVDTRSDIYSLGCCCTNY